MSRDSLQLRFCHRKALARQDNLKNGDDVESFCDVWPLNSRNLWRSTTTSSIVPFWLEGKVYCDTCQCGFETPASNYIQGARVRVECKDWDTLTTRFAQEAVTNSTGKWEMKVEEDHGDEQCFAILLTSLLPDCMTADPGRSRASLVLTRDNGVVSNRQPVNAMGFVRDQRLPECEAVLAMYPPLVSN